MYLWDDKLMNNEKDTLLYFVHTCSAPGIMYKRKQTDSSGWKNGDFGHSVIRRG